MCTYEVPILTDECDLEIVAWQTWNTRAVAGFSQWEVPTRAPCSHKSGLDTCSDVRLDAAV